MSDHTSYITLEHVSKQYEEGGAVHLVLQDVSIDFGRGEFSILLGRSGSGKSTLLNLISGIDEPSAGSVRIDEHTITRMSDRERTLYRRNHIGFIFQAFNLIPTLSVWENVILPAELSSSEQVRRAGQERAHSLLAQVGLGDRLQTYPDQLSGGEQQRVAIARALANDPQVVLADEPTGNLDSDTGQLVLTLLYTLTRQAGKNLIMVTHSEEVIGVADRVLHLKEGKVL